MGVQLFLMVYLVDTTPHNGCLRVLPGSHLQKIPLDDELGMEDPHAHGGRSNWSEDWAQDPGLDDKVQDMVSTYPGAVDVAVRAGDLVIGDSRLYHAAYRNASKDVRKERSCCPSGGFALSSRRSITPLQRRTCLTMWYIDWDACGESLRAAYGKAADHGGMPCAIPTASEVEIKLLQPLHPVFEGDRSVAAVSNRALGSWGAGSRTPMDRLSRL
jgi:hypothetical protein